jgi:four helix bundle protein
LDYQLLLARDLGYLQPNAQTLLEAEVTEIRRMLGGLVKKLSPVD